MIFSNTIGITSEIHNQVSKKRSLEYAEGDTELTQAYTIRGGAEIDGQTRLSWEQVKQQNKRLSILADPGMGKTLLLKMEGLITAETERQKLENKETTIEDVIVPLLLRLSDIAKTSDEDAIETILKCLQQSYPKTFPPIRVIIQAKLRKGNCLLLLDALDEVPKDQRILLAQKLDIFAKNFPCPIICTSRITGYSDDLLPDAQKVFILPFRPKQIQQYIEIWFSLLNSSDSKSLFREIQQKPQILGLSQNPLLLSLLCSLYQEQNLIFPTRRVEIYEQAISLMLREWRIQHSHKQIEDGWILAKLELLEYIAYRFFCNEQEIFTYSELRNLIEDYLKNESISTDFRGARTTQLITELTEEDGIIQKLDGEKEKTRYIFLHLTFQEYYTARYSVEHPDTLPHLIVNHSHESRWQETVLLIAEMLTDADDFFERWIRVLDDMARQSPRLLRLLELVEQQAPMLRLDVDADGAMRAAFANYTPLQRRTVTMSIRTLTAAIAAYAYGDLYGYGIDIDTADADVVADANSIATAAVDYAAADCAAADYADVAYTVIDITAATNIAHRLARAIRCSQAQGLNALTADLQAIKLPIKEKDYKAWRVVGRQLLTIFCAHFPAAEYELTADEALQMTPYLQSLALLLRCLKNACVSNRIAIEDRLLRVPLA